MPRLTARLPAENDRSALGQSTEAIIRSVAGLVPAISVFRAAALRFAVKIVTQRGKLPASDVSTSATPAFPMGRSPKSSRRSC